VGPVGCVGRVLAVCAAVVALAAAQPPAREVAITFDDLPVAGVLPRDLASSRALTAKLLAAMASHHIPAVGFVNEGKLAGTSARIELLRMWLDAGLELGNHTYSHLDLNSTPLAQFEDDVLKGEVVTRSLLQERGLAPRFFRHPFLHTGRSLDVRRQLEAFLGTQGYRVAPVTIDNDEYIFAEAYDRSAACGDRDVMRRVAAAYVPYMEAKFAFFERNSMELFGREVRQILLVHANALNADELDGLARMMERRRYRFIPLERALEDPAFQSPDNYVGSGGITWLHRWALTRGVPADFFKGEPDVPAFVTDAARPAVPPVPPCQSPPALPAPPGPLPISESADRMGPEIDP
jgi:peptidoglycan/xylan/chitin deacetylase (PgdA/CDA1 family)